MQVRRARHPQDLLIANLESATPPVATHGSPSGARIALRRETGSLDSRDAFVMNVLAEGSR